MKKTAPYSKTTFVSVLSPLAAEGKYFELSASHPFLESFREFYAKLEREIMVLLHCFSYVFVDGYLCGFQRDFSLFL